MNTFYKTGLLASLLTSSIMVQSAELVGELGGATGFGVQAMGRNDDGSSGRIDISEYFPNGVNFFGQTYTSLFVNNNGNITFNSGVSGYTPTPFPASSNPMIAPYWGDVDTRSGATAPNNLVYYSNELEGKFVATWKEVGYFSQGMNKLNSFQVILTDRSDIGLGDFDVEFRYEKLEWTTGTASGGSNGLGGTPAQVGFDAGDRENFYQHPESRTAGVLDLVDSSNVGDKGVWRYEIRNGVIAPVILGELKDVVVNVKIPKEGLNVAAILAADIPEPVITELDNYYSVDWSYDSFKVDQNADINLSITANNLLPGQVITAVSSSSLSYTDAHENRIVQDLGEQEIIVAESLFDLTLSTSKPVYIMGETVEFISALDNLSPFAADANVSYEILDSDGNLVKELNHISVNQQSAATSALLEVTSFLTDNIFAGDYLVVAKLTDLVSQQTFEYDYPFSLTFENGLNSVLNASTWSDKASYTPWDKVNVVGRVENTAINSSLSGATARMLITDVNGNQLLDESLSLNTLSTDLILDTNFYLLLNNAIQGEYSVVWQVFDADGELLSSSDKKFSVELNILDSLRSSAVVNKHVVNYASANSCSIEINNRSLSDINELPVVYQMIRFDGTLISETSETISLASFESHNVITDLDTQQHSGWYACVVQARIDGQLTDLAADSFEVVVELELSNTIGSVLVLVDPLNLVDGEADETTMDPQGPTASLLVAQNAALISSFEKLGLGYQLVDSTDAFSTQLNTGLYQSYFLASETLELSEIVQQQLNDLTYLGSGLLVQHKALALNRDLERALAIELADINPTAERINLLASQLNESSTIEFEFNDQNFTFHPLGAEIVANYDLAVGETWMYDDGTSCIQTSQPPAVSLTQFGQGFGIYAGSDLLTEAALMPLLSNALSLVHQNGSSLVVNEQKTLTFTLKQIDSPIKGRLIVSVPEEFTLVNLGEFVETEVGLIWTFDFSNTENNIAQANLVIEATQTGNFDLVTMVEEGHSGDYQQELEITSTLQVIAAPGLLSEAQVLLKEAQLLDPRNVQLRFSDIALQKAITAQQSNENAELSTQLNRIVELLDQLDYPLPELSKIIAKQRLLAVVNAL